MDDVGNMGQEELLQECAEKHKLLLRIREAVEHGGVVLNDEEKRLFSEPSARCLELIREDLTRSRQEEHDPATRERFEAMARHQLKGIEEDQASILAFTQEQADEQSSTVQRGLFIRDAFREIDDITETL